MKKLITIILILAMLLPAVVLADDLDPIVGCWYMYADKNIIPEFMSFYADADSELSVYYFLENGSVMLLDNIVTNGTGTPTFTPLGKWEKSGQDYKFSLLQLGEGTLRVSGDEMYLPAQGSNMFMIMRRIICFNPYKDITY